VLPSLPPRSANGTPQPNGSGHMNNDNSDHGSVPSTASSIRSDPGPSSILHRPRGWTGGATTGGMPLSSDRQRPTQTASRRRPARGGRSGKKSNGGNGTTSHKQRINKMRQLYGLNGNNQNNNGSNDTNSNSDSNSNNGRSTTGHSNHTNSNNWTSSPRHNNGVDASSSSRPSTASIAAALATSAATGNIGSTGSIHGHFRVPSLGGVTIPSSSIATMGSVGPSATFSSFMNNTTTMPAASAVPYNSGTAAYLASLNSYLTQATSSALNNNIPTTISSMTTTITPAPAPIQPQSLAPSSTNVLSSSSQLLNGSFPSSFGSSSHSSLQPQHHQLQHHHHHYNVTIPPPVDVRPPTTSSGRSSWTTTSSLHGRVGSLSSPTASSIVRLPSLDEHRPITPVIHSGTMSLSTSGSFAAWQGQGGNGSSVPSTPTLPLLSARSRLSTPGSLSSSMEREADELIGWATALDQPSSDGILSV
jgi:hypothetical protein